MDAQRDHIFISYASEDAALAEWLARKLTAAGYGVWMDRLKLLGGDRWPKEIDEAIKERSHCLVQLITTASLAKDSPNKERQLAFYLGTERKTAFFIPLNVEGIPTSKLPWQMSDVQYIPFHNWAAGLNGLLATLDKIECPKLWGGDGSALAIRSYFPERAVKPVPETVYSNSYPVLRVPPAITRCRFTKAIASGDARVWAASSWPNYFVNPTTILALEPPPVEIIRKHAPVENSESELASTHVVEGIPVQDVVISLVRNSFDCCCRARGLLLSETPFFWYFPAEAVSQDGKIRFRCYTGKETWLRARGSRKVRGETIQYALAFAATVRPDIGEGFTVQIKIRLRLGNQFGVQLDRDLIPSRRKAITGYWWNHAWLMRQEAIMAHLSQGQPEFAWGSDEKARMIFSAVPIQGQAPTSLDDDYLDSLKVSGKSEAEIKAEILESNILAKEESDEDRDAP